MSTVREVIASKLEAETGLSAGEADGLVAAFVRYYTAVAAYNRVAETSGSAPHPDSHPDREALALLLSSDTVP